MEEQLTITDYLRSQIELNKVMDLTQYINSKGKAQYVQIREILAEYVQDKDLLERMTNTVSVYVLEQSLGYMDYLRKESRLSE